MNFVTLEISLSLLLASYTMSSLFRVQGYILYIGCAESTVDILGIFMSKFYNIAEYFYYSHKFYNFLKIYVITFINEFGDPKDVTSSVQKYSDILLLCACCLYCDWIMRTTTSLRYNFFFAFGSETHYLCFFCPIRWTAEACNTSNAFFSRNCIFLIGRWWYLKTIALHYTVTAQ